MLRIVGSGLQLSANGNLRQEQSAEAVSGIGLSPLLLGTLGVLHESYVHLILFTEARLLMHITAAHTISEGESLPSCHSG